MKAKALIVLCLVCLPSISRASVFVSEIAWMGSADDANAEWIELYNADDAAADLTSWTVAAGDGQPSLPLAGTVPPHGFFLLERTDDGTVPEVTAGQVYTGALGNTGEVLELRDASGTLVDRVDGSDNWAIGGNNTNKHTLQRAGSVGNWITAAPSPGAMNTETGDPPEEQTSTQDGTGGESTATDTTRTTGGTSGNNSSSKTTRSGSAAQTVKAAPLPPSLTVDIGTDRTVAEHVPLAFTATVRKEGGAAGEASVLTWNFGDGSQATGTNVRHVYTHEGTYVVQLHAERRVGQRTLTADDRLTVRVVALSLRIPYAAYDSIEVANDSASEVDLSRCILASGKQYFHIPQGTIVLAGAHVRFSFETTHLVVTDPRTVGIFSTDRTLIARAVLALPAHDDAVDAASSTDREPVTTVDEDADTPEDVVLASEELTPTEPEIPDVVESTAVPVATTGRESFTDGAPSDQVAAVERASPLAPRTRLFWWLAALVALIGGTAVVLVLVRREHEEIIAGYVIDEADTWDHDNDPGAASRQTPKRASRNR